MHTKSHTSNSPLIELVKTPGRKKAIARKPKLMSKLSVVSLSLDVSSPSCFSFHIAWAYHDSGKRF